MQGGPKHASASVAWRQAHLGVVDELAHVADDAGGAALGVTRAVAQASVDDGDDEGEGGGVDGVDKGGAKQGVQAGLGEGVGLAHSGQQGGDEGEHLRVANYTAHLWGEGGEDGLGVCRERGRREG